MRQVSYKHKLYPAKRVIIGGARLYSLFNAEGTLVHFVTEEQLDRKTFLDSCIETFLKLSEHR